MLDILIIKVSKYVEFPENDMFDDEILTKNNEN